ncbi:hypothetical protein GY45DRAFT_959839 [Cubamyces sp. BRFM 1775]|nr:hypothetical protein GY45DRAFT_959839 [Cubamyces sp. BRFM 1775]
MVSYGLLSSFTLTSFATHVQLLVPLPVLSLSLILSILPVQRTRSLDLSLSLSRVLSCTPVCSLSLSLSRNYKNPISFYFPLPSCNPRTWTLKWDANGGEKTLVDDAPDETTRCRGRRQRTSIGGSPQTVAPDRSSRSRRNPIVADAVGI